MSVIHLTSVLLLNEEKTKVLLGKRLAKSFIGQYQTPGGTVEANDPTYGSAARREVLEEIGIPVNNLKECPEKLIYDSLRFKGILKSVHYFIGSTSEDIAIINNELDKCNDWAWHLLDKLPEPMTFVSRYGVEVLKNHLGNGELVVHTAADL